MQRNEMCHNLLIDQQIMTRVISLHVENQNNIFWQMWQFLSHVT